MKFFTGCHSAILMLSYNTGQLDTKLISVLVWFTGTNPDIEYTSWYKLSRILWLFLGLSWISLLINAKVRLVRLLLSKEEALRYSISQRFSQVIPAALKDKSIDSKDSKTIDVYTLK